MNSFETNRLFGRTLTLEQFEVLARGEEPNWNGFSNPYKHLIDGEMPIDFIASSILREPIRAEIGLILAVAKESLEIVGSAGFKSLPDERGMIEIGYGIVPQKQNLGLGKEFLVGAFRRICSYPGTRVLRYVVNESNGPSLHIIEGMGFQKVGTQIDPDEGTEFVFEQSTEDFLATLNKS
jgi:RimJ/RimL family protein N-acetyltransferase